MKSKSREDLSQRLGEIGIAIVFIALGVACWITSSYLEASAYRHATGRDVSTWDAMWLDLRVQSEPKE